ncbi:hypothetical protein Ssi03_62360 [Sphaerisporangium siamense]|uniref:Uncharacterized protein n=1 Tax=Sphaerisporangium siamense TaxID=795645 RepID=A0A7W7GAN6_9ACTN|nr:hypothetical protein [Sphaerisporangium siamense]MBB4702547.1 hypothetical protein [Sphaerisporangium siamense]GII88246.1 hypothetical protein Ssi03_62360 [Sphaerisporangium siamense]
MRQRNAQDYTPEEFDAVVEMIQGDTDLRADIEAITGQTLDGKTPRQLFNLFRTIQHTTEVQAAVVNYGRARQALRDTRAALEADADAEEALRLARAEIKRLELANDELRRKNYALNRAHGATPLPHVAGGRA